MVMVAAMATAVMLPSCNGLVMTSDGVNYVSTAENIARHCSLRNFSGYIERIHPHGYSAAMAPFVLMGVDGQWAARAVNWLALCVIGLVVFAFIRELGGTAAATAGALLTMGGESFAAAANFALSETLFSALVVMFVYLCLRMGRMGPMGLVAAGVCGVAMCLTRYMGLAVVAGVLPFLRWRQRLAVGAVPAALAFVGLVLTPFARPQFPPEGSNLWINLLNVPGGIAVVATSVPILGLLVWATVTNRQRPLVRLLAGVVAAYLAVLAVLVATQHFDPLLNSRLFVPIAACVYVLGLGLTFAMSRRAGWYLAAATTVFVALNWYGVWINLRRPEAKTLNAPEFAAAEAMETVRHTPESVRVYTNQPYAVHLHTGRTNVKQIPREAPQPGDNPMLTATMDEVRRTGGVMVWFGVRPGYMPPDSFLDMAAQVTQVLDSASGWWTEMVITVGGAGG